MRQILICTDFGPHKAGDTALVDDQDAVDAIASGKAVPSIEPFTGTTYTPVTEVAALAAAPEVK